MTKAVMLVPGSGDAASNFLATAMDLRDHVYGKKNAMIFKLHYSAGGHSIAPAFTPAPPGFNTNFWKSVDVAGTFMTVSHCGLHDGPMMGSEGEQPWPCIDSESLVLNEDAHLFWSKVGRALSTVKIIICGCDTGQTYGSLAAAAAGIPVYGFAHSIAAGVPTTMRPYIASFEAGRSTKNIIRCWPAASASFDIVHPSLYSE
ncbi:hypothetical protein [Bradyrhizobium lablabi]|uniref:hypothetical protein n=1 Tax=Bradyrhizobium lablabi TaxID=722472 RepID=UPI001BA9A6B8|nr:hypothetical protein [Bradyrhizobium lablabi]MBR0695112.1 hypothetical protein [Bradyrhizobium lablabi]